MPRPSARSGLLWQAAESVGVRLTQALLAFRPSRLPVPLLVLVSLTWLLVAIVAIVVAIPGLPSLLANPYTVGWSGVLFVTASVAGVLGAGIALHALAFSHGVRAVAWMLLGAALGVVPTLAVWAERAMLTAACATVAVVASFAFACFAGTDALRRHALVGAMIAAVLSAAPWLVVAVDALVSVSAANTVQLWLVGTMAAFVALTLSVVVGIVLVARSRHSRAARLIELSTSRRTVVIAIAVAAIVIALRITVLRDYISTDDGDSLWRIGPLTTWPMAALLAVVIVAFALHSAGRPYVEQRAWPAVLLLLAAATAPWWAPLGSLLAQLATAAVTGDHYEIDPRMWDVVSSAMMFVGLALLLIMPWVLRWRTTGLVVTTLAFLSLAPGLAKQIIEALTPIHVPQIVPAWSQVAIIITAITAMLAVVGWRQPHPAIAPRVLVMLALMPIVVLHAAGGLPGVWSDPVLGLLVIVGAIAGFVVSMPHGVGRRRLTRAMLLGTATLGGVAVMLVQVLAFSDGDDDATPVLGMLMLAMPLIGWLCTTSVSRDAPVGWQKGLPGLPVQPLPMR